MRTRPPSTRTSTIGLRRLAMDARLRSELLAAKRLRDEGLLDSASLKLLRNAIVQSVYPSVRGADSPFQGKSTPPQQTANPDFWLSMSSLCHFLLTRCRVHLFQRRGSRRRGTLGRHERVEPYMTRVGVGSKHRRPMECSLPCRMSKEITMPCHRATGTSSRCSTNHRNRKFR